MRNKLKKIKGAVSRVKKMGDDKLTRGERVAKFTGCVNLSVHTRLKVCFKVCVCMCVMEIIYLLLHHTINLKRNADVLQG